MKNSNVVMLKSGIRLYINVTNACNTNCPFCCMYSSTENSRYMNFDTFKSIVDKYDSEFATHPNTVYEMVYHPNGNLCASWVDKNKILIPYEN